MTPSPGNQGLNFDPSNPTHVAVRFTQIEQTLTRAQEAFHQTADDVRETMTGLRNDFRTLAERLAELPRLSTEQQQHQQAIARAFKAIESLATKTADQFKEADEDLATWKEKHEGILGSTRDKMILGNGIAIGISVLASCLVGVILYIYTGDKAAARERDGKLESTHIADTARLDAKAEGNATAIREIERYLTQEGTISGRPYTPAPRR